MATVRGSFGVYLLSDYKHCLNCDTQLAAGAKYCSECGQKTTSPNKPFLSFVQQSFHEILDIDGRLTRTLKTLFLQPGLAAYEFSLGKQIKYTPALRLYLVSSLLFFLVFASFQHIYIVDTGAENSAVDMYSRTMFLLFPLYAFFIKGFFWNSYYLHNLVFSMHIHSMAYIVLMIIGPIEAIESKSQTLVFVQAIPATYFIWYLLKAFKTMYQESWLKTACKTLGVYFIYMATLGLVFDFVLR
ncbi:DUF3667 domain-containing protein [Alteromonas facilis]|uniref:DUF3667 domain-containing protein n=1 Tax=Alteromonas facilis TaxID=2048004 RepID=UPI000C28ED08|nr:DUF3667 domain-containing protein [Alteromonas facilis]